MRRAFRGGRLRSLAGSIAGVAAAAAALAVGLFPAAATTPPSGPLQVADGAASAPGLYVTGDQLVDPTGGTGELAPQGQRLAATASSPLVGGDGPVAAPSPVGHLVAYSTWSWTRAVDWTKTFADQGIANGDDLGTPTLRVRDIRTQVDNALEPGTFDGSWRADGALAYVRGDPASYRVDTPYLGNVVVRTSAAADPVSWTTEPDRYRVFGWAGRSLVVLRGFEGGGSDVEVLDGPGRVRLLAADAGMLGISPDGTQALVSVGAAGHGGLALSLRKVADSTQAAALSLSSVVDPVSGHALQWVGAPASWVGDHVVLGSDAGLLVLRVSAGTIAAEQVLHVDLDHETTGSLYEPRFADASARTIVWWADAPGDGPPVSAQYVCDRFALTCTRAAAVASARAPRPVYDLSGGS